MMNVGLPNQSVKRTGMSRSAQCQMLRQRRLIPVAHLGRWWSRDRLMTRSSPRKVLWLAVLGTGCLVFLLLLLPAKPQPRALDFRVAGRPQMTNGAMLISFVLSNGTSRPLNIVDDAAGNPFLVLDAGTGGSPPGSGDGNISTMPDRNTERLKETPTKGSSQ